MKKSLSILFLTCALSSFGQIDTNAVNNTTGKIDSDSTKSTGTTIGGGLDFNYAKAEKYILGPIRIEGADNFRQLN
jgi:outer membrane protein insertion porin family